MPTTMVLYAWVGLLVGSLLRAGGDVLPSWRRDPEWPPHPNQTMRPRLAWLTMIRSLLRRHPHAGDATLWRGLLLELGTMSLFAYLWRHYGLSPQLVPATLYTCLFVLISVIDMEHRLVLNAVVFPASILALSASFTSTGPAPGSALLGGMLGFGLFALVALAYRGGMGDGDVKLAGLIGLITGFPHVVVALVVGVLAGGLVALLLLLTKIKGRKSYIPYAPFLVIGGMVAMLYGPEIMAWYASLVHR